jgi:hypothetical protein
MRLLCLLMVLYAHHDRMGPLQVYHRAGKLIPRLVDPWLDIEQIFMTGLTAEDQLQIDGWCRPVEDETADKARYFSCLLLSICT